MAFCPFFPLASPALSLLLKQNASFTLINSYSPSALTIFPVLNSIVVSVLVSSTCCFWPFFGSVLRMYVYSNGGVPLKSKCSSVSPPSWMSTTESRPFETAPRGLGCMVFCTVETAARHSEAESLIAVIAKMLVRQQYGGMMYPAVSLCAACL